MNARERPTTQHADVASRPAAPGPSGPSEASPLQRAASLLATGDDESWDELLYIVQHFERHDAQGWQDLTVAALEAMVANNAREALGRDPWSSLAPLMTLLLHRLARNVPAQPRRAVQAICALFDHLRAAHPITLPDGLPGAVVALARAMPANRATLVIAFSQMVNRRRLRQLLTYRRTNRHDLRSLRRMATDDDLVRAIDDALLLGVPGASAGSPDHR